MKKLLPLIACSLFSQVSAVLNFCATPEEHLETSIPLYDVKCEVYAAWLYLQPNASNLHYSVEAIPFDPSITTGILSPDWKVHEINPDFNSGFEIGAKLAFSPTNMNAKINWERFRSHTSAYRQVPLTTDMIGPMADIGPNSSVYKTAYGKADFHFDTACLQLGKQVCFCNNLYTNFNAGVAFAHIKQSLYSSFTNLSNGTSRSITSPSRFIGAGPQLGVDFDYKLGGNFFFTGSTSLALLMGQLKNKTTYTSQAPLLATVGNPQPNTQTTYVPDRTQLIPGFEEKLGFAYALALKGCILNIKAGYQFQIYLDAIQSADMTAPQVPPSLAAGPTVDSGVFAVGFERTLSNFILTGPYVSLNLDF